MHDAVAMLMHNNSSGMGALLLCHKPFLGHPLIALSIALPARRSASH